MDPKLKELMRELGNAIDESVRSSDRIAEAIGEIKRAGYDVFLVLEATIGFNKREDDHEGEDIFPDPLEGPPPTPARSATPPSDGKLKLNSKDQKFLKALKIVTDIESRK
jgi:hypothetical protein